MSKGGPDGFEPGPHDLSPLDQRLQLPNQWKIFAIYALTLLMYTAASPNPKSATRGETP